MRELVSGEVFIAGQSAIDSLQLESEAHLTGLVIGHDTIVGQLSYEVVTHSSDPLQKKYASIDESLQGTELVGHVSVKGSTHSVSLHLRKPKGQVDSVGHKSYDTAQVLRSDWQRSLLSSDRHACKVV